MTGNVKEIARLYTPERIRKQMEEAGKAKVAPKKVTPRKKADKSE